ncbi:hypothetical protein ACVFVO_14005 [Advenella kashmirensis]
MNNKTNHTKDQPNFPCHVATLPRDSRDPKDGPGCDEFINRLLATTNANIQMRARLDALPDRYPRLFPKGHMARGFEISSGWTNLVVLLCERIDTLLQQAPDTRMQVKQVKEKFGMLRFYYEIDGAPDSLLYAIREVVAQAELASSMCCERCGKHGETGNLQGWLTTVCRKCAASL